MAIPVFNLRRGSRLISIAAAGATAIFLALAWAVHLLYLIGAGLFGLVLICDVWCRLVQRQHAVLRNFGIFGAMRYLMESIGPELRQYWIASDTEEAPFSRRERAEVYRHAKDVRVMSAAFGTQKKEVEEGTIRHSFFPLTVKDLEPFSLVFGEERGIEQAYAITKPFMISGMSFGALGEHAVRALARGASRVGIPMCTGEGGYPKYHLKETAHLIFQMGTAKFGCRNDDSTLNEEKLREIARLDRVKMIEIKFSQGAKPGKGGMLPAAKVSPEIAGLRGVPEGKDVYSPPRHVECDTPENTVRFIRRVQEVSERPVGIKFCLGREAEFGTLIQEMKRQGVFPDYIALDGAEGGTGAAPAAFLDHVGVPLFPALEMVVRALRTEGVRDKLKLVTAGKLINAARQFRAFALGADAVYTARGFLLALGCIQAMQCNTGDCPTGITTHDRRLQRGLDIEDKAERVANYARNLEHFLQELLAAAGCRSLRDLKREMLYVPEKSPRK